MLEAVGGYLKLAMKLKENKKLHGQAFKCGTSENKNYRVIYVVKLMKKYWNKVSWKIISKKKNNFYESSLLNLNVKKAKNKLKWQSILTFDQNIKMVTEWYKNYYINPKKIYKTSISQIKKYEHLMKKNFIL